jgi:hypothetical protein
MHRSPSAAAFVTAAALATALTAGCSPALDWREVRPDDSGAMLLMPCKPASHARRLPLAGAPVAWTLYACSAGEVTWALGFADLGDPTRVGAALAELEAAALGNIGAAAPGRREPLRVAGATPQAAAVMLRASGRRPDGTAVEEQVALFTKGTRVYQATAVGARLPTEAIETFFDSLRTP